MRLKFLARGNCGTVWLGLNSWMDYESDKLTTAYPMRYCRCSIESSLWLSHIMRNAAFWYVYVALLHLLSLHKISAYFIPINQSPLKLQAEIQIYSFSIYFNIWGLHRHQGRKLAAMNYFFGPHIYSYCYICLLVTFIKLKCQLAEFEFQSETKVTANFE